MKRFSVLFMVLVITAGCTGTSKVALIHVPQTNVVLGFEPPEYPGYVLIPKPMWVQIQKKMEEDLQK